MLSLGVGVNNRMINVNELIGALNAHRLYSGKDKNERPFLTVQDDEGKAHFINRTAVIDVNGNRTKDANGKDIFVWVLGAELQPQATQPELPLGQ